MYAVIRTGGKQYKVAEGDRLTVERLPGEAGSSLDLDEVLLIADGETTTVGTPLVAGAKVAAEVIEQTRGDKVIVFKKKRRHNYKRTKGHRQDLTLLRITGILADGKPAKSKTAAAPTPDPEPTGEASADNAAAPQDASPSEE